MRLKGINKRALRILIMSIVCISTFVVGTIVSNASANPGVEYRACTEKSGWQNWVRNKVTAGDISTSDKIQVVKILLTDTYKGGIAYKTYAMGQGWQEQATNGDASGSTAGIQAIRIELFGDIKANYSIKYRVHLLGKDWTPWVQDGKESGVTSGNDVIDGYEVILINKEGAEVTGEAADYSADLPATEGVTPSESKSTEVVMESNTNQNQPVNNTVQTTDVTQTVNNTVQTVDINQTTNQTVQTGTGTENTTQQTTVQDNSGITVVDEQVPITNTPQTQVQVQTQQVATNELAKKLVEKAANEVGYKQDASGLTKYGQWWAGKVGDSAFEKAKWSSMFLAWCGNEIGLSDEQYGYYACSDYWVTWFKNNNAYHEVKDYTPQVGDMIFFDYDQNGTSDHNGIVKSTANGQVYAIEGNIDGEVKECNYDLTDTRLKGYGTPLFDKVSSETKPVNNTNTNQSTQAEVPTGNGGGFGSYTKLSTPITGIDVSTYNGNINWSKVKNSEAKFAYIRLGGRHTKGYLYTDTRYHNNIKAANDVGMDVGIYFFTQAISKEEAIEEANYVLEKVKGYKIKYPIAIDTEYSPSGKRTNSLSKAKRTEIMKVFCDKINSAGYKSQIYSSKSWFSEKLNIGELNAYDKWVAQYTTAAKTSFAYPYSVWQYTDKGSIPGISGNVDKNRCYVAY